MIMTGTEETAENRRKYIRAQQNSYRKLNIDKVRAWKRQSYARHKNEIRARCRKEYAENVESHRAYDRARYAADPEKYKARARVNHARLITDPAFVASEKLRHKWYMRERRGLPAPSRPEPNACECCGKTSARSLHLDHDHATGAFRGWLCSNCNTALGKLGDDLEGLNKAVAYLSRFS